MKLNVLGLDIASKSCQASLVNDSKQEIFNELFSNSKTDLERLLSRMPANCLVVMESTSHYHLRWARALASYGHRVFIVNPLMAKRMQRGAQCLRQNKTDKIDAYQLALLGVRDLDELVNYEFKIEANVNPIKQLCKTYSIHRKILTELLVSAKMLLESMVPAFDDLDLAHSTGLVDLFLLIDSWKTLSRMHKGRIQRFAGAATQCLVDVARSEGQDEALFDAYLPALQCRLKAIKQMRELLIEIRASIRKAAANNPRVRADIQLVQTIPGFGPRTAAPIIASLPGDWVQWGGSKREKARKLQAFWGFDPRKRESGKWRGTEHISKRGSELARTALFQTAVTGRLHDEHLAAVYARKHSEGMHHLVIITHLMRIQLQRMVSILVSRQPYVAQPIESIEAA